MTNKIPVCPQCGSENIAANAIVSWGQSEGGWLTAIVHDDCWCNDCDAKFPVLKWRDRTPEEGHTPEQSQEPTVALATLDALEALLSAHRLLAELEDERRTAPPEDEEEREALNSEIIDARLGVEDAEQGLKYTIMEQVEAHIRATRPEAAK